MGSNNRTSLSILHSGVTPRPSPDTGARVHQLETIDIPGTDKRIELWQGDLTDWASSDQFDALLVSAYHRDYQPSASSMIGALHRRGVDVAEHARDRDMDLPELHCWLSRPLPPQGRLPYRQLICFERPPGGSAPELVGDIFRAMTPMALMRGMRAVAMPVIGSGDQGYGLEEMLVPILEAATHWMSVGHPLERLVIASHSPQQAEGAQRVFERYRAERPPARPAASPPAEYDVFVSYSQKNSAFADDLVRALHAARPSLRIFVDRRELNVGAAWQIQIFESLERARRVVAIYSPDYIQSRACQEEFNIAWIRARRTGEPVLLPIYGYSAVLPDWMRFWQYTDCREGDAARLSAAVHAVLHSLDQPVMPSPTGAVIGLTQRGADASTSESSERMACPRCAESIQRAATVCRFCWLPLVASDH